MFCTFVSLEWKTILLQSTLPTRWPSLDSGSMHRNQWRWRVCVDFGLRGQRGDGQDVFEATKLPPRWCKHITLQGYSHLISCVLDIAHTAPHKQSKCQYLLSKSPKLQWGALRVRDSNIRIQTENSSPRQARYVAFWAVLAECWPLILILSPLVPVCRRAAAPGRAELG